VSTESEASSEEVHSNKGDKLKNEASPDSMIIEQI